MLNTKRYNNIVERLRNVSEIINNNVQWLCDKFIETIAGAA